MTRAGQEGTVPIGDAAAGRVCCAFEDAGDGRGAERGGDDNGGAREGKLTDVRRRCRKRQHASRRRVERRRRCDKMRRNNQPALTKRGGRGWTREAAVQRKAMQGGGGATRGNVINSQQTYANRKKCASGQETAGR
jgi:hypothetical protein